MTKKWQIALALFCGIVVLGGVAVATVFQQYENAAAPFFGGICAAVLGVIAFLAVPIGRRRGASTSLAVAMLLAFVAARYGPGLLAKEIDEPPPLTGFEGSVTAEQSAKNLVRGLDMARQALQHMDQSEGYTCDFAKRERAKNVLRVEVLTDEKMVMKIRHEPFSVYTRFVEPAGKRGTEAIYVAGKHNGNMVAHTTDPLANKFGIKRIEQPTDHWMVMIDNRHPITSAGMKNLLHQLLALSEKHEEHLKTCEIRISEQEEIGGRPCKALEIFNPHTDRTFPIARARIYLDDEWLVPTRYEAWDWVWDEKEQKHVERLMEHYTYTNLKFEPGFSELDFDPANPAYEFPD